MEQKTIGKFLSALRKANGYTQQQVADMLSVSNKTISKWECDDGYPEITVLPAIAELYGVTVDEILKGERIEDKTSETTIRKVEERTKLLYEHSGLKFKNSAVVAVSLGILSTLSASFFGYLIDASLIWIIHLIALIVLGASVIVALIGANNYKFSLKNSDTEFDTEEINNGKSKIYLLISAEIVFVITTIIGMAIFYTGIAPLVYPTVVVISLILAFAVYLILLGKVRTEKIVKTRKIIRRFIAFSSAMLVVVVILATAFAYIDTNIIPKKYCFTDKVGFAFDSVNDAITQYNNVKNYFEKCELLVEHSGWGDDSENNEYYVDGERLNHTVSKNEGGYIIEEYSEISEHYDFDTKEEFDDFLKNHTITSLMNIDRILECTDINFRDETYTITYKNRFAFLSDAIENIPVFAFFGSCGCLLVFLIYVIILKDKENSRKK